MRSWWPLMIVNGMILAVCARVVEIGMHYREESAFNGFVFYVVLWMAMRNVQGLNVPLPATENSSGYICVGSSGILKLL